MERNTAIYVPLRESRDNIEKIAAKALARLTDECYIVIGVPSAAYTVAYRCLETAIRFVAEKKSEAETYVLNFYDLFDIGVSYMATDEAEKDGNYTPIFTLRPNVAEKIKKNENINRGFGINTDEITKYIQYKENSSEITQILNRSVKILDESNKIACGQANVAGTITAVFFEEVLNWMATNMVHGEDISINFVHLVEFGITYEDNTITPYAVPGQEMKLIIKNDSETEEE
jgi:hypothetical protein